MKKEPDHPVVPSVAEKPGSNRETTLHVLRELADTTWRIAVPVLLFAGAGIYGDIQAHSGPWITLAGVVVGFVFAGVLVRRQIKRSSTI